MASSLFEGFPEVISCELSGLIDDVVAVCFERNPTRFLNAHHVPMVGTKQSLITFEFDREAFAVAFDFEFLAALRTRGFELPRGHNISHDLRS